MQYADDESAEFAKTQYENAGYTADYDSVITTSSTSIGSSGNWSDEWAYEETDAVSALDYYKLRAKLNINIAVVDSGINYNHELFKTINTVDSIIFFNFIIGLNYQSCIDSLFICTVD